MVNEQNTLNKIHFHENKKEYFVTLPLAEQAHILLNTTDKIKKELLFSLPENEVVKIFKFLDPDEIVDLLQLLPKRKQTRLINKVSNTVKENVKFLSRFAPQSAAGVMNLNYLLIPYGTKKSEIKKRINHHLEKGHKEPTLLVIDDFGHLLGELRISMLLFENDSTLYKSLKELPSISSNEDQETCLQCFKKHIGEKVVVLDGSGFVLGIIKAKEMLRVVEQESEEDYYGLAGLKKEEEITATPTEKVRFRLSWLLVNLITAFFAAFVVTFFEDTVSKVVLLAAFMPIIAGMGGNAGTQTTAIVIRSLALNRIDLGFNGIRKIINSEFFASFINGVVIGTIVGALALALGESILFALVAFVAILANLVAATVFGIVIPIVLQKLDIDPAAASNVFVTTIADVFGLFVLLGLATLLLL